MKKVIVISIIIAAVAAVLAVCAVKTDLFKQPETEKPAVEQQIKQDNLRRPIKINPNLKSQRIKPIDKEKLRESLKKMKKNQSKDPNSMPKRQSCGE